MAGYRKDRAGVDRALRSSGVVVVMTRKHVKTPEHMVTTMWEVYQAGLIDLPHRGDKVLRLLHVIAVHHHYDAGCAKRLIYSGAVSLVRHSVPPVTSLHDARLVSWGRGLPLPIRVY